MKDISALLLCEQHLLREQLRVMIERAANRPQSYVRLGITSLITSLIITSMMKRNGMLRRNQQFACVCVGEWASVWM